MNVVMLEYDRCIKCISVLLYGLEVCDLPKRTIQSLDISVNRVLMKLFRSSNIEIIAECRNHFGVELPSVQLANASRNLVTRSVI